MSSGFHPDADEICTLLGYYEVYSGNSVPMFHSNLSVLSSMSLFLAFLTLEDGTNRLSQNVSTELLLYTA